MEPVFEPQAPIVRNALHSSNIRGVGYDPGGRVLEVEFTGGGVYRYAEVPFETYRALLVSPSVGKAFQGLVRGQYAERRMPRPEPSAADPAAQSGTVAGSAPPAPAAQRPPRPAPPRRARTGPKPGPVEAAIDPDRVMRPEERLADGRILRGARPCGICGGALGPDADRARGEAGILRCRAGHVDLSPAIDATRLEVG